MKKRKDFISLSKNEAAIVNLALENLLVTFKHLDGDFYWEEKIAKTLRTRIYKKQRKEYQNEEQ